MLLLRRFPHHPREPIDLMNEGDVIFFASATAAFFAIDAAADAEIGGVARHRFRHKKSGGLERF